MTQKSTGNKRKITKLDHKEVKNFCVSEDARKTAKRQCTERDKIFANHISDKVLV